MNFFCFRWTAALALLLPLFLAGCGYNRSQVTLTGTPGVAKSESFEPAILDRLPGGNIPVIANATKTYRSISWAQDACRDLGCNAVVVTGIKPRQKANLFQMSTSTGSSGPSPVQTHTTYDAYYYQFVVLP